MSRLTSQLTRRHTISKFGDLEMRRVTPAARLASPTSQEPPKWHGGAGRPGEPVLGVLIDNQKTYISVPKVRVSGRVRTARIAGSPGPASRAANRASASEWALLTCCVGDWPTGQGLRGAQLAQPPCAQQRPHSRISSRPANRAAGRVVFTLGSQLSEA